MYVRCSILSDILTDLTFSYIYKLLYKQLYNRRAIYLSDNYTTSTSADYILVSCPTRHDVINGSRCVVNNYFLSSRNIMLPYAVCVPTTMFIGLLVHASMTFSLQLMVFKRGLLIPRKRANELVSKGYRSTKGAVSLEGPESLLQR